MLAVVLGAQAGDVTDVLDNAWTGVTGTNYTAVTGLTASSDAVYSVQCAGGNSAIQLRSNNNNSGIVTTTSGGDAKTLKVTWNDNTNAARVIQVYGSATAYSSPSDLYDSSKQGTLIGELGTSATELDLEDYAYIGIRSKNGALYIDKVEITWSTGGPSISKPTLPASTSFVDEMEVTITNTNETGTIYYTTDGGDPTEENDIYTGAFTITETTTVKAVVVTEAGSSPIASATYTKIAKSTIAEVLAGDSGETYYTEGTVIAAGAGGFIVADAEDYIYVYYSAGDNNFRVGNQVKIIGATTEYKGTKQFTNAAQITEVGNSDVNYPTTHTLFSTEFEAAQSAGAIEHGYYDFTGKLTISGNYFNIAIEGTDAAMGALIKPFDDLSELDGKVVEVTGYGLYVNSKYVYFIATNVEEYVEKFSVTMADGVEGGSLEIEPATAAADATVTVTVIPDEGKVLESITANCVNINQAVELNEGETPEIYTFLMPADDVVINPVFADAPFEPTELDVTAYQNGWKTDMAGNGVADYTNSTEPKVDQKEHYNGSTTELTGVVLYQDIEGLEPGTYTVSLVANASYTPDRGFNTEALNGDLARVQVFANNIEMTVPVLHQTGVGTNNGYTMRNVNVGDDGKLSIGIRKDLAGSNWHTIQITKLVWESQDQISDPDTYNEYWQGIRDAILAIPAYSNVAGVERSAVSAAGDEAALIAALPAFYAAKDAYDALAQAIENAKSESIDVSEAEAVMAAAETTADDAAQATHSVRLAYNTAKATDGADMTFTIVNPSFETGDTRGWTFTPSNDSGAKQNSNGTYTMSNCDGAYLFNIWSSGNAISQTIEDLPNGTYKLQAVIATDGGNKVQLNANTSNVQIDAVDKGTGVEGEVEFEVLDNKATIGAEGVNKYWYKVDNFRLTYVKGYNLDELIAAYQKALDDAQGVTGKMNVVVEGNLASVIAEYSEVDQTDADALTAATAALTEATAAATNSVNAYAKAAANIEAFKAEVESTNVVSATAKSEMEAFLLAFEEGTLTDAETEAIVNPTDATAWRQNPTQIGEYILSAWDEEPYNWGSYHPNTWSVEGNNDGSNFRVPFIEYWTGDGASLAEKTLTATVTDLTPGIYEVTAWTRVRIKDGAAAPATGITFQVGDGEAVDVTTGEIIGAGPFYIGEFTATGVVGEDGVLTIKYNVAADNNISWLAFKNVNYTRVLGYAINVSDLTGATVTTNPEGDAYEGTQVSITVETEEGYAIDAVTVRDATGAPVAEVQPSEAAANVFFFTMPASDVTIDVTLVEVDPNDYTYLIQNPAYLHEGGDGTANYAGWTWSPAPGESGWKYRDLAAPMNLVTYSGNVNFSFEQTIPEVPAGQYRLSVYGFYRAGSAQDEANRVTNGDVTHNLNMFAEYGDAILTQPIMNLYEGAAEEDVTGKGNHCVVNGYTDLFVPDGANDSRDFYIAGYYRNDLIINITEAGEVKIGINHPTGMTYDGDYAPIGAWELYRLGDPELPTAEEDLAVERYAGMGYSTTTATVDFAAAKEFLGIEDVSNATLVIVNPDGTEVENYDAYDGWFAADGSAKTWQDLNNEPEAADKVGINVKFFQAIPNGEYTVCDMNSAVEIGAQYTVTWALKANGNTYKYNITVTFAEKPIAGLTYDDLTIVSTAEESFEWQVGTAYQGGSATVDVASFLSALEVESLNDVVIYAVQSNGSLDDMYKLGTSDGWRNADGDWQGWGADAYFYVKADFTAGENQIYEVGTMEPAMNTNLKEAAEFTARYVFVKNGSADAVQLNVNVALTAPEPPALTYDDLNIIAEQGIEFNYDLGTSYQEDVATVDVAAIKAAFETPAEPTLTIYAVLSDNTLDPSYGVGTSDGWRNADGDWESWSGESVFCVKADFEAESDQIYYVGTKMAASQTEDIPGTYVARYVFVNEDGNENPDAVLFTVTINYGNPDSIEGILADKTGEQKIFDLSGRRIETITKGGMYIINGKKVFVK